jgi:hypothetical protein
LARLRSDSLEEVRCAGLREIAQVKTMDLGRASRIFRLAP